LDKKQEEQGGQAVSSIKIKDFINEPWQDVGLDAEKRGVETCKRNGIENPQSYLVMIIGLCDIINELKAKEAKP
jgi:hypothetical protein